MESLVGKSFVYKGNGYRIDRITGDLFIACDKDGVEIAWPLEVIEVVKSII